MGGNFARRSYDAILYFSETQHLTSTIQKTPLRVLSGFGRAVNAVSHFVTPRSVEELAETFQLAKREGVKVAFRGAGRSYGDAALNTNGLIIDTTKINQVIDWNPETGIISAEPGLTIEGLWKKTLEDGYWPAVVPGTMRPTLGGCIAMNIHGKNNFKAGPFGEHVLGLELLTTEGEKISCSPTENADLFYAVIGGLGMLGAVTKVRLKLKKIESGNVEVRSITAPNLDTVFDTFEKYLPLSDYLVGWIDCLAQNKGLGRGIVHAANYLAEHEDPKAKESLRLENQGLPSTILGFPKSQLWKFMQPFMNNPGVSFVNSAKFYSSWASHQKTYRESHVAFAFLLDYVPNWRLSYGLGGFIQYQIFVPNSTARDCFRDVLAMCHKEYLCSFLGVLKRHRPDQFLLSHALDGWSLALDFKADDKPKLWKFTEKLTERVLEAGGKFYFAKDAVLRPTDVKRAYGEERLAKFAALRSRLDPSGLLSSDLWRRISNEQ
jgi:decaprenylphospho-beta-D-ribofuranose 2-oxidase